MVAVIDSRPGGAATYSRLGERVSAVRSLAEKLRDPRTWRLATRRIFLLLAPISVPVWLLLVLASGFFSMLSWALEPIGSLWNDPPKRMRSYYKYGYTSENSGRADDDSTKIVLLRVEENRKRSA